MHELYLALALLGVFLLASFALFRTYLPPPKLKELRRAFEALEEEFEEQRDHVRSALGRVSRLKRSMLDGTQSGESGEPSDSSAPVQSDLPGLSGLTPRQNELQKRILARRRGHVQ